MEEIQFWVEWTIGEGNLDAFRSATVEGNQRVADEEPGAVSVRSFFSEDGTRCHLYECYKDSQAAIAHATGAVVADVFPKFAALAELTRLEVHGRLSDEARDLFTALGARVYTFEAGFAR